jgi:hypothetical protein
VRVSLKSQLLKSHVPSPTSPGGKSRHWGDGSRPNSLVGAIQLDVISPQTATAKDFNGWILVENFSERLGTMSMFENPGGAIGTVLEGLWWTPYATMQSAISFNLENDSQSFLIVKNTADKPRKPRMVLDYNEGRDHYNVDAAEIPPQQNVIVDIEHMRNAKTPDINGHTLPSDVKFGGSVIFSEPGAFVISDPTLAYGHTTTEGNDPVDEDPFFIFSCVRDTSPSDRGGGDGGGTLNMDLACDKAGMGCLLQGSPTPLCAILRCRKSYCNDHPCTRDERRKAYDANEYYNITNCDLFPCRQRPD